MACPPFPSPLRALRERHSPVSAMAHARFSSLLVIALLQLSQTEISSTLPESWYAANVINDGAYSPKPISEIFSTQASFSSTNPIIVLQSSTPNPTLFTSPSPRLATSTVSTTFSTTERPSERPTEISVVPLPTEQPVQPESPESVTSQSPPVTIFVDSPTTREPQPPQLPELSQFQQPPSPPSPPPVLSTPQQIQIQTAPQGTPPPPQIIQNQPPNYILVYQQAPQTLSYPQGTPQQFVSPVTSTSALPPVTSTLSPRPLLTSTPLPLRLTSTTMPRTSISPQTPCTNGSKAGSQLPSFRIRLVAPSGSVTNVKINPPITTTTRRPTTTRTRRTRNRNNYDGCVSGCGGKKVPICASPLGVSPIDPDTLKGFPSVCHMACHNSFRKNLYEKVMDGRCGRLRTRIKPVDSKNKLKKDDLNKATYTVVQGGPSVIEFSPLDS